jgi:hypothetical protein
VSSNEPLWAIGTYETPDGRVAWEISRAEIQRDITTATRVLCELGIARGTRVLLCSLLAEAGQFWPFTVGTMLAGAQLSCADAGAADANRVAMFLRQLDFDAVLGVTGALLDGLHRLGRAYHDVFGGVAVLGARPDAYARLVAAGLRPHHFVLCGPAVGLAREPGAPALVDRGEWDLGTDHGRVVVTNRRSRATRFVRTVTAVRGAAGDLGVVPVT